MPQPIVLPRKQNPWELLLPQMVNQYLSGSIRNKFAADLLKQQTVAETQARIAMEQRKRTETMRQERVKRQQALELKQTPAISRSEFADRKSIEYDMWKMKEDYKIEIADPKLLVEDKEKIKLKYKKKFADYKKGLGTPKETPEQKRAANLQAKKNFHEWKTGFEAARPDKPGVRTPNQQRVLDQSLAAAGTMILNNAESEAVKPQITYVNKYLSSEPYIYTWITQKGKLWGEKGKAIRVDLPQGVKAEDIKFTMKKEKKSLNQVLRELKLIE